MFSLQREWPHDEPPDRLTNQLTLTPKEVLRAGQFADNLAAVAGLLLNLSQCGLLARLSLLHNALWEGDDSDAFQVSGPDQQYLLRSQYHAASREFKDGLASRLFASLGRHASVVEFVLS